MQIFFFQYQGAKSAAEFDIKYQRRVAVMFGKCIGFLINSNVFFLNILGCYANELKIGRSISLMYLIFKIFLTATGRQTVMILLLSLRKSLSLNGHLYGLLRGIDVRIIDYLKKEFLNSVNLYHLSRFGQYSAVLGASLTNSQP